MAFRMGAKDRRRRATLAAAVGLYLIFLGVLVLESRPRRVGDGVEYISMAMQFRDLRQPAMRQADVDWLASQFASIDSRAALPPEPPCSVYLTEDGRCDHLHFWAYSLLAAPLLPVAELLPRLSLLHAFALLNAALLVAALVVALPRVGAWPTVLLFGGPVIWWIDKAHTEVFTFSLLGVAGLVARDRPGTAMIAIGLASTQNQPIAVLLPVVAGMTIYRNRNAWRRPSFLGSFTAAAALALLSPIYYLIRLGTINAVNRSYVNDYRRPSLRALAAPISDLNIGLLVGFPLLAPAVLCALVVLVRRWRVDRPGPWLVLPAAALPFLLFAFSQTRNINSGGTPGLSRYAVWLIPLTLPVFAAAREGLRLRGAQVALAVVAVASVILTLQQFRPVRQEDISHASPLAKFVWDRHPHLDQPLVEIFVERNGGEEVWTNVPVEFRPKPMATPSCSKVLLVGGASPRDCPVPSSAVPAQCRREGQYCYADRVSRRYRVHPAPRT